MVMKKIILFSGILILSTITVHSQITKKKASKKAETAEASPVKTASNKKLIKASHPVALGSTNSYSAKSNAPSTPLRLTISDPILRSLNRRADGADIKINKSGIVGMPRSAYGFANGHLTLSTSGSTTSGTQTGSGLVGTGTSLGTFGSAGPALQVNGKSPFAGVNMWGNAMNLNVIRLDSTSRLSPNKRH